MEIVGRVVCKPYATGSKSERDAVVLETAEGDLLLRREGGNPFHDEVLDRLVGRRIRAHGRRIAVGLILSSWEEL